MRQFTLILKSPPGQGKSTFLNYLRRILMVDKQFKIVSVNPEKHEAIIEQVLVAFPEEVENDASDN